VNRPRAAGWALAACALVAWLAPAAARAEAVGDAQFRALAARAVDDPAALAQLRAVDRVDGSPVDVRGTLRGVRGRELDQRLRMLAARAAPAAVSAAEARAQARDILSQSRFTGTRVPGPFHGLIDWVGDRVRSIGDWLDDLLPGGRPIVWLALAALIATLAVIVARRTLTRRVREATQVARASVPPSADARELERRAGAAEAAGDLQAALRLRFLAGLLRLDERGAIEFRPSISTSEVRRTLRSVDFDVLAFDFDEIVYGGRPAAPADVESARRRWPDVVAQARPKAAA
jgi:hypothetical protein